MKDTHNVPQSRIELEQQLRLRADQDASFRQALIADPRALLERDYANWFAGGRVPETVTVTEEDEHSLHLVLLPPSSDLPSEIDSELLETVQGAGLGGLVGKLKTKSHSMEEPKSIYGYCNPGTKSGCSDNNPSRLCHSRTQLGC